MLIYSVILKWLNIKRSLKKTWLRKEKDGSPTTSTEQLKYLKIKSPTTLDTKKVSKRRGDFEKKNFEKLQKNVEPNQQRATAPAGRAQPLAGSSPIWTRNNRRRWACLKQTNLLVQGWVSIDRSEVAALLSTTPRPKTRSSTNDLAPPRRMGSISCRSPRIASMQRTMTEYCGSPTDQAPQGPWSCIRASRL